MHSTKRQHLCAAVLSVFALAGLLSVLLWVDTAGANQHKNAQSTSAVLVISSNTHLILEPEHTAALPHRGNRMACKQLLELPFVSIGMNCRRVSGIAVTSLAQ